jgi:SAM-dependent methyltransferase
VGVAVRCPCCERRFRRFEVVAALPGELVCPGCGSYSRQRLVWLYLRDETELFSASLRVLHLAPQDPMYQQRLRALPNLDYVSGDLEHPDAMVRVDAGDMPFEDESFDVVLANHLLASVDDDRRAMAEIHRVLRPGGWALLQVFVNQAQAGTFEVPLDVRSPAERRRLFGGSDLLRVYGRDYVERLRAAGFHVHVDDFGERLPQSVIRRHGLAMTEPIYRCGKA